MQKTVPMNSSSGEFNIQLNEFKISNPDEFNMFFSSKGWFIDSGKVYYQSDLFFEGKKLEDLELQNALRSMCTSGNVFKTIDCKPIYHLSNAISQPVFIKKQLNDFVKRLRLVSSLNINGYSLNQILKSDFGLAVALDHHINRPGNVISHIKSSIAKLHERNSNISSEISEWGSQHAVNEAALLEIYGSGRTDMTDGEKRFNNLKLEFGV